MNSQKCPKCDSEKYVLRILYGLPAPESRKKIMEGKLISGGCRIYPNCPEFKCKKCDKSFGNFEAKYRKAVENLKLNPIEK